MSNFAIVTDSFCELNDKIRKEFDIDFVPGHFTLADGTEKNLNLEWDIIGREEFYSQIKKNPDVFKTSPANVAEITEKFESYAKEGTFSVFPFLRQSAALTILRFRQKKS